ncbi:uncharacterized protein M6B38_255305 [Iris pallida]|uniref:Phospholipase n=1 Tax=Iris pallida TaxID=29817 RepID=A0AAX6EG45_IRIPA|nr:uncharacterized protein M6B38_190000 [Iris pallida]KAJ6852360.1 uncharacterized protein M6B38_255305 [Iris pallida]
MEFRFPPDVFALLTRSFHSVLPARSKPAKEPASNTTTPVADPVSGRIRIDSAATGGCSVPIYRFRPYVAKVPWHGGARAFLSQLFPRYGHYCGPNWSSGKDGGSMLWDRRPIDWLDFCCYCHDIGYDTHDQSGLLRADLAFLECLERPRVNAPTRGDSRAALLYRSMCIAGLRSILIPYRMQLVRLQSGRWAPFPSGRENLIPGRVPFSEMIGNLLARRPPFLEVLRSLMRGRGNNAFRQNSQ